MAFFRRYYGSEFINYGLLKFCETEKITFTRSRAYRSNDQGSCWRKNGSIVRRLVGHGRYEGVDSLHKLAELYSIMRLYINFFQPSVLTIIQLLTLWQRKKKQKKQ